MIAKIFFTDFIPIMKVTNNTPTFRGYKNIISNSFTPGHSFGLSMLAMELNDEDGYNDLTEYRKLQKLHPDLKKAIGKHDNVIFCTHVRNNNLNHLILNARPVLLGEELKLLKKTMPENIYRKEEDLSMKAFTFLAKITGRIAAAKDCLRDSRMLNVYGVTYEILSKFIAGEEQAFYLLRDAVQTDFPAGKTASIINSMIHNSMMRFFK